MCDCAIVSSLLYAVIGVTMPCVHARAPVCAVACLLVQLCSCFFAIPLHYRSANTFFRNARAPVSASVYVSTCVRVCVSVFLLLAIADPLSY